MRLLATATTAVQILILLTMVMSMLLMMMMMVMMVMMMMMTIMATLNILHDSNVLTMTVIIMPMIVLTKCDHGDDYNAHDDREEYEMHNDTLMTMTMPMLMMMHVCKP